MGVLALPPSIPSSPPPSPSLLPVQASVSPSVQWEVSAGHSAWPSLGSSEPWGRWGLDQAGEGPGPLLLHASFNSRTPFYLYLHACYFYKNAQKRLQSHGRWGSRACSWTAHSIRSAGWNLMVGGDSFDGKAFC